MALWSTIKHAYGKPIRSQIHATSQNSASKADINTIQTVLNLSLHKLFNDISNGWLQQ